MMKKKTTVTASEHHVTRQICKRHMHYCKFYRSARRYGWHFRCLAEFLNVFFFKQKTAYELRISDWSSDVCSSDLLDDGGRIRDGARKIVETILSVCFLARQLAGAGRRAGEQADEAAGVAGEQRQIGRASCRERVRKYV